MTYGKWRKYLYSWGRGEDPKKVIPQRVQAGDSQTCYSAFGLDATKNLKRAFCFVLFCFLAFPATFVPLQSELLAM